MRDFEDYCWRDLLTPDMVKIYAAYHRERIAQMVVDAEQAPVEQGVLLAANAHD